MYVTYVCTEIRGHIETPSLLSTVLRFPSFQSRDYEQPGLQPTIQDAGSYDFAKLSPTIQELVCLAKRVGEMGQVTADGFLHNRRHNLAMGLGALHIAQHMQVREQTHLYQPPEYGEGNVAL